MTKSSSNIILSVTPGATRATILLSWTNELSCQRGLHVSESFPRWMLMLLVLEHWGFIGGWKVRFRKITTNIKTKRSIGRLLVHSPSLKPPFTMNAVVTWTAFFGARVIAIGPRSRQIKTMTFIKHYVEDDAVLSVWSELSVGGIIQTIWELSHKTNQH